MLIGANMMLHVGRLMLMILAVYIKNEKKKKSQKVVLGARDSGIISDAMWSSFSMFSSKLAILLD